MINASAVIEMALIPMSLAAPARFILTGNLPSSDFLVANRASDPAANSMKLSFWQLMDNLKMQQPCPIFIS
jgi:hypothetical protein